MDFEQDLAGDGVNPEVDPKTRVQPRVEARAMLCYIAHKQYGISFPAISKFLKKDRSTMYMHGAGSELVRL